MKSVKSNWYKLALLLLIAILYFIPSQPVQALNIEDYFNINYSSKLSQSILIGNETSVLDMSITAVCNRDLPIQPNEAQITGSLAAIHDSMSVKIVVIPNYTINIKEFPAKSGEIYQTSQSFNIRFPSRSQTGKYTLVAESKEALVNLKIGGWINVTRYLPQSIILGSIDYTSENTIGTVSSDLPDTPGIESPHPTNPTDLVQTSSEVVPGHPVPLQSDQYSLKNNSWLLVVVVVLLGAIFGVVIGILLTRKKSN
jgi:hypothetical protein